MPHGLNVPLTPQTDPNNFPPYVYRAYPKMLTREATVEDVEANLKRRQVDPATHASLDPEWKPMKVGQKIHLRAEPDHVEKGYAIAVGDPIVVRNPGEEYDVTGELPANPTQERFTEAAQSAGGADNARIEALEARQERQESMLAEMLSLLRSQQTQPSTPSVPDPDKSEVSDDDKSEERPRRGRPRGHVIEGD